MSPAVKPFPETSRPMPLKTYEGDFSDRVKETKASTVTVLAAEQDAAPLIKKKPPKNSSRRNLLYSIAGALLIIFGAYGAYVAYTRYLAARAPVLLAPVALAPIFVDERDSVSGAGTALSRAIEQSVTRPLASGAVRLLSLETGVDTNVFSALQLPAPDVLLRNLGAADSMAGIVNIGGEQSPFFILSVASFGDTFAGMLSWESRMPRDLSVLFPPHPASMPDADEETSTATTTPADDALDAPSTVFLDTIVANHDVRVHRDTEGRAVLLYGYWDQTTLVVARDEAAFVEILRRLATSRSQP